MIQLAPVSSTASAKPVYVECVDPLIVFGRCCVSRSPIQVFEVNAVLSVPHPIGVGIVELGKSRTIAETQHARNTNGENDRSRPPKQEAIDIVQSAGGCKPSARVDESKLQPDQQAVAADRMAGTG